jgi:hypothetical protein
MEANSSEPIPESDAPAGDAVVAKRSWMPNVGDILFVLTLYLMLFTLPNFLLGDGSTGWHLVTGHWILDHGQIPRTDLISYTFPDKAWVAYEWLFDVVLALIDRAGGPALVAVAVGSAIAALFMFLYESCRRAGCYFFTAMLLTLVGSIVASIHWLARPHIVTFFGLYIYSRLLEGYYRGDVTAKKLWFILGLSMLIWVNCHPAFLAGFVLIGIYLCSAILIRFVNADPEAQARAGKQARDFAIALGLVVLVSFVNPYHVELYKYVWEYLHQGAVLSQNTEFMSPTFHGALQPTCLEILFFLLCLGLATSRRKPTLPQFLAVLAFAHLALSNVRSGPFFVIVALPFIAEQLGHSKLTDLLQGAFAPTQWLSKLQAFLARIGATFDEMEFSCTMHILPILVVSVLAISCLHPVKSLGVQIVKSRFDPKTKPIETLDYLEKNKMWDKNGLNYDNWGGYIRYKTGHRVFIDDRSDFYGENFYLDYGDISVQQPGWQNVLDKYKIEWVIFPKEGALVAMLKETGKWKVVAEDTGSVVLVRKQPLSESGDEPNDKVTPASAIPNPAPASLSPN